MLTLAAASWPLSAQERAVTADAYARAEKFMTYNTTPLVLHGRARDVADRPGRRFWYRVTTEKGSEAVLVDPPGDTKRLRSAGVPRGARGDGGRGGGAAAPAPRLDVLSPDGKRTAFIRDWNLWVRDVAERQGDAAHHRRREGLRLRHRQRRLDAAATAPIVAVVARLEEDRDLPAGPAQVGEMYLVDTQGRPSGRCRRGSIRCRATQVVTMIQRVVIDVDAAKVVRLQMPPDQHRSTLCDDVACRGDDWDDVQWSADGSTSPSSRPRAITSTETAARRRRGDRRVRDVLEEKVATFFESGNGASTGATCRPRTK